MKYIYKYVYKGSDRILVGVVRGEETRIIDEIALFRDAGKDFIFCIHKLLNSITCKF
jgi:hypothetical protein